jgi:hypothetical protein
MNTSKEQHDLQRLATMEQTARLRAARLRAEANGADPLADPTYQDERRLLNELVELELDAWKQRHGYAMAERDEGRQE